MAFVTLGLAAGGAALAFLRSLDEVRRPGLVLAACAGLAILAAAMHRASRPE